MTENPESIRLQELELKYPVNNWTIDGVRIWPWLRIRLMWDFRIGLIRTDNSRQDTGGRLRLVSSFFHESLKLIGALFRRKPVGRLFLSRASYRAQVGSVWCDKFCDSYSFLHPSENGSDQILEMATNYCYRVPRTADSNVLPVNGLIYFYLRLASFLGYFMSVGRKVRLDGFEAFMAELGKFGFSTKGWEAARLAKRFRRILYLARLFRIYLKVVKPRQVFVVCYYEEHTFALVLAANQLGIETVDIQHGVQGYDHPAYTPFASVPEGGWSLVPDWFFVWDEPSWRNIQNWNSNRHRAEIVGNLWSNLWNDEAWKKDHRGIAPSDKRKIILVTVQPIHDTLPDFVLSSLARLPEDFDIYLRLHPRQLHELDSYQRLVASYGLADRVNIAEASNIPLPVILDDTVCHLTHSSSVVMECCHQGIPSVIYNELGITKYWNDYSPSGLLHSGLNEKDLIEAMTMILDESTFREKNIK